MHKSFFPLFIVSLVGILALGNAQHSAGLKQYSSLLAGITPLVVYHAILLRKRLLTPTEVDSVYYFGFLVTMVTLVSMAISIGLSPASIDLRWVLFQFGLGLVATGYALFARLHLLAKSTVTAETDIVDANERLAKSVERVAGEFDKAGFQVAAFVEQSERRLSELEQRTQAKFAAAEAKFEQHLNEAATHFDENLAKSSSQSLDRTSIVIEQATTGFSVAISSVIKEIDRVQVEAKTISFQKASERIAQFAGEMEQSVASISGKVSEAARSSADAISDLTSASRKATELATNISTGLSAIGRLEELATIIESSISAMRLIAATSNEVDAALSSLAAKAGAAERGIREGVIDPLSQGNLTSALSSAERSISAAAESVSRVLAAVDSSLRQSAEAISAATVSSAAAASLASEAPAARLFETIGDLSSQVETLRKTLHNIGAEIERAAIAPADREQVGWSWRRLWRSAWAAPSGRNTNRGDGSPS